MRWGVCAEEFCFNAKLPAALKAYFGSGKILPINRGSGENLPSIKNFTEIIS